MKKNKKKKKLILHVGYPKAASSYLIQNVINIAGASNNCINVNYNYELLKCFDFIRDSKNNEFNQKFEKITKTLAKYLLNDINFFGYERALHITAEINKKKIFFKRLKKISNFLNLDIKLVIILRNKLEMIISSYKEDYFRIILRNIEYFSFEKFLKSIINKKNRTILENIDYKNNINEISKIFSRQKIFIGKFESLIKNKKNFFKSLMKFCLIKKYNLDLLKNEKINNSLNKKFFSLIKLRIFDYFFFKKIITLSTLFNCIEIFLRIIFFQSYLNKLTKINQNFSKKLVNLLK
jgi:hypothetical protein